jgi:hypothetical protein
MGVILTGDHCTESPFASSGCYPSECHIFLQHRPTLLGPLRSYGLMRQTKTLSQPRFVALCHESLQVAAYPCRELALPDVISSIFVWVLGPVPRLTHPVHSLVSSRTTSALPQSKQVRRAGTSTITATSMMATVFGAVRVDWRLPWLQDELCVLCLPPGFPAVPPYFIHT